MKADKPFVVRPMTLKEQKALARLAKAGLDNFDLLDKLQETIASVSNWTYDELDQLTTPEFYELLESVKKANSEGVANLVPLSNGSASAPGENAEAESSQVG